MKSSLYVVYLFLFSGLLDHCLAEEVCQVCDLEDRIIELEAKLGEADLQLSFCRDQLLQAAREKLVDANQDSGLLGKACSNLGNFLMSGSSSKSKHRDQFREFLSQFMVIVDVQDGETFSGMSKANKDMKLPHQEVTRDIRFALRSEDLTMLRRFVLYDEGSVDAIEEVVLRALSVRKTGMGAGWLANLSSEFLGGRSSQVVQPWMAVVGMALLVLCCIILPIYSGIRIFNIIIILGCYIVFHTWLGEYWKAVARKEAILAKYSGSSGRRCNLEQQGGMMTAVADFFSGMMNGKTDPCEEYYRAVMVDPVFEVNLVHALVETLSQCMGVLGGLGAAVGNFYTNLIEPVPLVWKVPILLVATIVILFLLLVIKGYGVKTLFFSIGPSRKKEAVQIQLESSERDQIPDHTTGANSKAIKADPSSSTAQADAGPSVTPASTTQEALRPMLNSSLDYDPVTQSPIIQPAISRACCGRSDLGLVDDGMEDARLQSRGL